MAGVPNRGSRVNWLYRRQRDQPQAPARCLICGMPFADKSEATIEHLTPVSAGGTDALHNLALSHARCNQRRGNRPLTTAQQERHDRWFPGPKRFGDSRDLVGWNKRLKRASEGTVRP